MPSIADNSALAAMPIAAVPTNPDPSAAIAQAAGLLLPDLERGRRIDAATLRAAMERAFGGSDADGTWDWKTAYDACEAATVLFLRKFGQAVSAKAASPAAMLPMLAKIAGLLPTHTRRSEESQALQQFSTPITLGLAANTAAAITPADLVLEPSAGTGLLAIFAELADSALILNELADVRAGLLDRLFPVIPVSRFDAAQIDDHLGAGVRPSVVLMNPPFSAMAHVERAWPTRRSAMSAPPSRASPMAAAWSLSPGQTSRLTIPPGRMRSFRFRSAAVWCSRPRSTARSMPSTARPSIRA